MGRDSTKGHAQTGEGRAGDSSKKTAIACEACRNMYKNNHAFAGHKRHCKYTKEPKQDAIELAEDQSADKMVDRNSEEVIAKSGGSMSETEPDSLVMLQSTPSLVDDDKEQLSPRSLAATSPEKDCKFTDRPELNAEGQAGTSAAGKIWKRHSWGSTYMTRFGFVGHRRHCKSTKEPEQNTVELAEDQSADKMVDRNSEEVIAKSGGSMSETESDSLVMLQSTPSLADDDKEQLSPRSLAATSLEKDCKFTNVPELNVEGQVGASPAGENRKCDSCGRTFKGRYAFAGHRGHCKYTKEPKQNAIELVEDQSAGKMVDRNSEDVIGKWGGLVSEAEWETVDSLVMLQYSAPSLADDGKEQLSPRSLAATSL